MPHPNPITAAQLATSTGRDAAEFSTLLDAIDQDALFAAARKHFVASVWDRTTPINGNAAEAVLASLNPPQGGAVVAVGDGKGATSVLQGTDPTTGQPIDPEQAQAVGDRMADEMAADRARGEALQQLPAELLTPINGGSEVPAPAPTVAELAAIVESQGAQILDLTDTIDGLINFVAGEN